jgi:diphosphomevalonate decarboxylase
MEVVRGLRRQGLPAYFTMDAGPHVKVLTNLASAGAVRTALAAVPGVSEVMVSASGDEARV